MIQDFTVLTWLNTSHFMRDVFVKGTSKVLLLADVKFILKFSYFPCEFEHSKAAQFRLDL